MTVTWGHISIPFAGGIDTKSDAKALGAEKLADLQNGVFTKRGSIIKRPGQIELPYDSDLTDKNGNARAIGTLRMLRAAADELIAVDSARLLTWNPTREKWFDRGAFRSPVVTQHTVADQDTEQTVADCCTGGGYVLHAWQDSRGGIYCHMIEESTRGVVIADRLIDSQGSLPRCVYVGGVWHVVYADTGNSLKTYRIEAGGFAGTAYEIANDLHGTPILDVESVGDDYFYVAYKTTTATTVGIVRVRQDGTTDASITSSNGNGTDAIAIAWQPDTERLSLVVAENGGDKLYGAVFTAGLAVIHAQNQIVDYAGSTVTNVTARFPTVLRTGENTGFAQLDVGTSDFLFRVIASGHPLYLRDDCTIEMWVNFIGVGAGTQMLMSTELPGGGGDGYFFYWYNDGVGGLTLNFDYNDYAGFQQTSVTWSPSVDTWYHVAVTRSRLDSEIKFYVDGVQQGATQTATTGQISAVNNTLFRIGTDDGGNNINARVDDVRCWTKTRSVTEIAQDRSKQLPISEGLIGYWRLNGDATDSSGEGRDLTESGVVTYPASPSPPFSTYTAEPGSDDWFAEVFYEFQGGNAWNNLVNRVRYSIKNEATTGAVFMRHAGIAGRAYTQGDDVVVPLCHDDAGVQRTLFHVADDLSVYAKILSGTHTGLITAKTLPGAQELGDGRVRMAAVFRRRLASTPRTIGSTGESVTDPPQENEVYSGRGIKEITLDYEHAQSFRSCQIDRTSYLGGGFVWQYDGISPVESGFHLFPANITATPSNGTGSIPIAGATGTYYYVIYYEWTNARGERERSTFGAEVRCTLTAASGHDTVTLSIPTLSFTQKRGARRNVSIVVYRTEENPTADSPRYRVSSPDPTASGNNGFLANDPTVDTVSFVDGMKNYASDAGATSVLIEQELDYKNAQELDNVPPEACHIMTEGKDRIFLAGFEDPNQVRYSKQRYAGAPVEFNDALEFSVPEDGGAITALGVLNEALAIFKSRRIYVVTGSGPNNLGGGQAFPRAQLVTTDVGCVDARTVVQMPLGLMFQSSKGIYVLTQQLQVRYIGADVEAYNGQTYSAAHLLESENRVVFLAVSGRSLNYNYLFNQWSTFTNYTGADATVWAGALAMARGARVRQESSGTYTDAGVAYPLVVETAWLKLRGLQGYQRARRALVLGEFHSAHKLRMELAYDYEPGWQGIEFDPVASGVVTTYLGDPSGFFGDGTPFGSGTATAEMESAVYQFRAHLPRQKCQSIKFRFTDRPSAAGDKPAQAYELTEIMLEVGRKRGTFKPSDGKTIG